MTITVVASFEPFNVAAQDDGSAKSVVPVCTKSATPQIGKLMIAWTGLGKEIAVLVNDMCQSRYIQ